MLLCRGLDNRRHFRDGDGFLQLGRGCLVSLLPTAPRMGLGGFLRDLGLYPLLDVSGLDFRLAIGGQTLLLLELDVAVGAGHLALALGASPPLIAASIAIPATAPIPVTAPIAALLQVAIIRRLDVGDVEETIAADAEVDE